MPVSFSATEHVRDLVTGSMMLLISMSGQVRPPWRGHHLKMVDLWLWFGLLLLLLQRVCLR